jgi:hypothetical protein
MFTTKTLAHSVKLEKNYYLVVMRKIKNLRKNTTLKKLYVAKVIDRAHRRPWC